MAWSGLVWTLVSIHKLWLCHFLSLFTENQPNQPLSSLTVTFFLLIQSFFSCSAFDKLFIVVSLYCSNRQLLCCASFVSFSLFTFIRYLHSHLPTYQCQSRFTNTETRPSNTLNDNPRHYRPPYYIFPRSFQLSHYFCSFCLICCWSVISCIAPPQVTASPKKSTPQPLLTACLHWPLLHCWLTACVPSFPPIHYYLPWLRGFLP